MTQQRKDGSTGSPASLPVEAGASHSPIPSYPQTLTDIQRVLHGLSVGPQSQTSAMLDSRELWAIQDALQLSRFLCQQSLSQDAVQSLLRLELRLLFLWETLSPLSFPQWESQRLSWLQNRVRDLFRDPRSNPSPG